jgi:hypothetical protein
MLSKDSTKATKNALLQVFLVLISVLKALLANLSALALLLLYYLLQTLFKP